jgi:mRNA interferase RelE/StbE
MRVVFRRAAEKALDRIPEDCRRQILSRLRQVVVDPSSRVIDVRPLAGSDLSRLRVGDYRLPFSLDRTAEMLIVEAIGTRGEIYTR